MTCTHCGAPMTSDVCEYCGYGVNTIDYAKNGIYTINVGGEKIQCYLTQIKENTVDGNAYRDTQGILHREQARVVRTFTLVEY